MMGKKAIESARVFVEERINDSLSAEQFLVERKDKEGGIGVVDALVAPER